MLLDGLAGTGRKQGAGRNGLEGRSSYGGCSVGVDWTLGGGWVRRVVLAREEEGGGGGCSPLWPCGGVFVG